jgi:hypothetical protein
MSTSGKYLTVASSGVVVYDNHAWRVDASAKELDRSTGAGQGFGDVDAGLRRATITIDAWVDVDTASTVLTDFQEGTVVSGLELYFKDTDATPAYSFPFALVLNSNLGGEVDGQFQFKATLKNKGEYTPSNPSA